MPVTVAQLMINVNAQTGQATLALQQMNGQITNLGNMAVTQGGKLQKVGQQGQAAGNNAAAGFRNTANALSGVAYQMGGPVGGALANVTNALYLADQTSSKWAGRLAGIGAVLLGLGTIGTAMGAKLSNAQGNLHTAIDNTGKKYDDYSGKIKQAVKDGENLGFTQDKVIGSLATLTTALKDPQKALDALGTVEDAARKRNRDLETSALDIARAMGGYGRGLRDLGINITELNKQHSEAVKTAKASEAADKALEKAKQALADKTAIASDKLGHHASTTDSVAKATQAYGDSIQRVQDLQARQSSSQDKQEAARTDALTNAKKAQAAAEDRVALLRSHSGVSAVSLATAETTLANTKDKVRVASDKLAASHAMSVSAGISLANSERGVERAHAAVEAAMIKANGTGHLTVAQQISLRNAQSAYNEALTKSAAAHAAAENAQKAQYAAGLTGADILKLVKDRVNGAAEAHRDTLAGAIDHVKAKIIDFTQTMGQKYGPSMQLAGTGALVFSAILQARIPQGALSAIKSMANLSESVARTALEFGKQTALMIKDGVAWAIEHAAMAAGYIAENIAMAASATAAFIAENAATLGIGTAIAALVVAIVYVATHWKQVWGDIKQWIKDGYEWVHQHILLVAALFGPLAPVVLAINFFVDHWKQIWNDVKQWALDAWHFIDDYIIHPMMTAFDKVKGVLSDVTKGINIVSNPGAAAAKFFGFGKATGGEIPGYKGQPQLALVHGGEYVMSNAMRGSGYVPGAASGGSSHPVNINVDVHGSLVYESDLVRKLRDLVVSTAKANGGDYFGGYA